MWRLVATAAVAAAVILGCAPWLGWADARAAGTAPGAFSVRASGAGKPVRSPVHGGKCAKGQQRAVLARAAALASLASELTSMKQQVSTLSGQVSTLQGDDTSLKSQVSTLQANDSALKSQVSTLQADNSSLNSQVATLNGQVSALQSANNSLPDRVSALEQKLTPVSYSSSGVNNKPTLTISGANLQVNSGSGSTDGTVNGLGNVIIGYDENPGTQSGSNNLVLGNGQAVTWFGGVVAGQGNSLSGPFSDAFGHNDTAAGGTRRSPAAQATRRLTTRRRSRRAVQPRGRSVLVGQRRLQRHRRSRASDHPQLWLERI